MMASASRLTCFLFYGCPTIVLELWLQFLASIYYTDYHFCFQLKMLTFEQTIEGLWQFIDTQDPYLARGVKSVQIIGP
jgi:hypothetical protein